MKIIKIDVKDERYPQRLLNINNFPTEIYAVGNIELLNTQYSVGIVGSRECTDYGRRVTKQFAKELSRVGICIVSGMAIGVDGIAHDIALQGKGKTIAVIGGGFNHIYPKENEWLFYKILEEGGCIISEYVPDVEADKSNFPKRNRIISGLSDSVLVVEAAHRSGSKITAKYAKAQQKKIYAIPNSIYENTGIGTNTLIQEGAILTLKPKQIIEDLIGIKENNDSKQTQEKKGNNESKYIQGIRGDNNGKPITIIEKIKNNQNKLRKIIPKEYLSIYRILSEEPTHINEIAKRLDKSIQEISSIITMMEIDDYICQIENNYFIRKIDNIE